MGRFGTEDPDGARCEDGEVVSRASSRRPITPLTPMSHAVMGFDSPTAERMAAILKIVSMA